VSNLNLLFTQAKLQTPNEQAGKQTQYKTRIEDWSGRNEPGSLESDREWFPTTSVLLFEVPHFGLLLLFYTESERDALTSKIYTSFP